MRIVSLVGPKGSGKDTVFEILRDLKRSHGKISFAGPLKEICSEVFQIPIQVLNDPVLKEKELKEPITLTAKQLREVKKQCTDRLDPYQNDGTILYNANRATVQGLEGMVIKTPRELMQVIGTDFIRNRIYDQWHLRAAFNERALSKLVKSGTYCVTDTRFFNEYQFLKEKFGDSFVCYYVERPEAEEKLKTATHDSELEVLKIKAVLPPEQIIKNDGSLKDLEKLLKDLKLPEATEPKKGSRFKFAAK